MGVGAAPVPTRVPSGEPAALGRGTLGRKLLIRVVALVAAAAILLGLLTALATQQLLLGQLDRQLQETLTLQQEFRGGGGGGGALTRIVGAGVVVLSALSISYLSWYKFPAVLAADGSDTGGIEYDVALGLLGLLLFAFGAGAVAVDRLFKRKKPAAEPEDDSTYSSSSSGSTAVRTAVRTGV